MAQKNTKELSILDRLKANEDESLPLYLAKMGEFDKKFCDSVISGNEFTIRLEVRGDKGKLVHCRIYNDEIARPGKGRKSLGNQDLEE